MFRMTLTMTTSKLKLFYCAMFEKLQGRTTTLAICSYLNQIISFRGLLKLSMKSSTEWPWLRTWDICSYFNVQFWRKLKGKSPQINIKFEVISLYHFGEILHIYTKQHLAAEVLPLSFSVTPRTGTVTIRIAAHQNPNDGSFGLWLLTNDGLYDRSDATPHRSYANLVCMYALASKVCFCGLVKGPPPLQ